MLLAFLAVFTIVDRMSAPDGTRRTAAAPPASTTAELAETIAAALEMPPDERAKRAALLREGATALPPRSWFARQREDLSGAAGAQTPG